MRCREITEYDGYKLNPKRLSENASEEEKRLYEAEKAIAKQKSEEILKRLRSKGRNFATVGKDIKAPDS